MKKVFVKYLGNFSRKNNAVKRDFSIDTKTYVTRYSLKFSKCWEKRCISYQTGIQRVILEYYNNALYNFTNFFSKILIEYQTATNYLDF